MPFVKQDRRAIIDGGGFPVDGQPGDFCYLYYKPMVDAWSADPRWTTADAIYQDVLERRPIMAPNKVAALDLAWQVFFNLHVMPYELKKREENGDIHD